MKRAREAQIHQLAAVLANTTDDVVVCGDFNVFGGWGELATLEAIGMRLAPGVGHTYPARQRRWSLDIALYHFHDSSVVPQLRVLGDILSNHRPIVLEW